MLAAFSGDRPLLAFICCGYAPCLQSASILYTSADKLPGDARCPLAAGTTWGFPGMLDAVFIAAGLAFFVVATLYTYACDLL